MAENIVLDREITEKSQNIACKIENSDIRKRAYALNIAATAVANYLSSKRFDVDTACSLYKVPEFVKNLEIADIYIDEKRLDVRVTFDEKIFYIPKAQEKFEAQPCAYIVTKLDSNLKSVEVLGFIPVAELDKQQSANEYYCYETAILKPINELRGYLQVAQAQKYVPAPDELEKIKELAVSFVDEELSESEKIYFMKSVLRYAMCREVLSDMNKLDGVAGQISHYEELLNDSTLSVLSGNEEEVEGALLANLATVENAEENFDDVAPLETEEYEETAETVVEDKEAPEYEGETVELAELEPAEPLELTEEVPEAEEEDTVFADGIQPDATIDEFVEEEEEIIKPMGVLALEEAVVTDDVPALEVEPVEEVEPLETEIDSLVEEAPELEEKLEESLDEVVQDLELTEDAPELVAEVEEEELVAEAETPELGLEEVSEELSVAPIDFEEEDNLSLGEEEHEDLLLSEEDNDDMLLDGVADLLEEEVVEESAPVEEVNEEVNEVAPLEESSDAFSLDLEGEEEETEALVEEAEMDSLIDEVVEEAVEEVTEEEPQVTLEEEVDEEPEDNTDLSALDDLSDLSDLVVETEQEEETTEAPSNDEEIQKLLDDDLMGILAEDGEAASDDEQVLPAATEEVVEEVAEEDSFAVFTDKEAQGEAPDTIETLFDADEQAQDGEEKQFELAQEPVSENRVSAVKNIIIGAAIFFLLVGGSVAAWFMNHNKAADNNAIDPSNQDGEMFDLSNGAVKPEEDQQPALSQDINKSMTNSFSDKPAAITITKLSWQVSEKLAAENSVKEYLQTAGKNIQINLQNDLANSADINFNNSVKVSFEIAPDNTMKGMQVLESSGSDQVDEIVTRSIKNTLKYVSVPKLNNFNSDFFLTLIINF